MKDFQLSRAEFNSWRLKNNTAYLGRHEDLHYYALLQKRYNRHTNDWMREGDILLVSVEHKFKLPSKISAKYSMLKLEGKL